MRNREFVFTPKIEYKIIAERSEANPSNLQFPQWCSREDSNLQPVQGRRSKRRAYASSATGAILLKIIVKYSVFGNRPMT